MSKDYYKILGVEKGATENQIKAAFRKLAHQYHPDKPTGDEAKFKEINEAYQVIGNAEKRQQYDQFGADFQQQGGFGGNVNWDDFMRYSRGGQANGDFGDLGDIFGDIFGFSSGRSRSTGTRQRAGDDISLEMTIDFRDAVFGIQREIPISRSVICDHCHGNMAEPGTALDTCGVCKGQGQVVRVQRTFLGAFQTATVCNNCNGTGSIVQKKCTKCHGQGKLHEEKKLDIKIPAGIDDGMTLRLRGQGQAGSHGGPTGDLYIRIRVRADKVFDREGYDLFRELPISFTSAALGGTVEVETLDGKVDMEIPAGTQPNTKLRLRGHGVPTDRGRGDLYVHLIVEIPKKLSKKQREMLEKFDE